MRPPGSHLYLRITRKGDISTFSTSNCIHIHNTIYNISGIEYEGNRLQFIQIMV